MQFYTKNERGRYDLITASFTQLVTDIAVILKWDVKEIPSDSVIHLTNGTQELQFRIDSSQSTDRQAASPKISIGCILPGREWHCDPILKQYTTNFSFSANRGADAIAKDIQKRILPGYFELWGKALEHKQKEDDHKNKLRSKTQQLADILRTHPHPNCNDGNTISPTLKIKPEVGQSLGINLNAKDYINLKAEVSLACDDDDIDDVKITTTLPYELATEFFEWLATKTVDCFETWHQAMIEHCIKMLNKEAKASGQPELKELPPNNFNWGAAYIPSSMGDTHANKQRLFEKFKESIIELEIKPVEETIEEKIERLTVPYDQEALIRAYKRIGYNVNPSQLKDDLKYLTQQFNELSDWIKLVLERGLYNDFQYSFHKDVERRDLIGEIINKLEAESTQPQAQPQAESEPKQTTREDDITELFGDDPELCEILCRLSLYTPWQYREVLKDELLRIRDRRVLRTKLEAVQKIKDNPQTDRLLILEQLEQLHSSTQINVLVRSLKKKFSSFKEAKLATNTKAISWEKLAEKLAA